MQLLLVSVCLVICSSSLILATDPHYVIFLPKRLEEKSQEKVCVTIEDLNCELHLKLELKKGDHVQKIAEQDITTHDFSHCFSFQVPAVEDNGKGWSIHVSGQGEHLKIDETRDVIIEKIYYSCVVQTDKSTYKPGDTVRFRLMSVDHNYHISDEMYKKILLEDPDGNFIGQWLDQSPVNGIVDLSYHLGDELKLGIYKLSVPSKCTHSFTVAEYASKRFEVNIKLPSTLTSEDKTSTMKVCGSYTYGKPVQGHFDIEICEEHREIRPYFGCYVGEEYDDDDEEKPDNCIKIKHAKTDSDGCLSKEIDLKAFNAPDTDDRRRLHIVSTLTEDGTGHIEKASADVHFGKSHEVKFEDTGMFYQHGIPFKGKVKAIGKDNHPLAHVKVAIIMQDEFYGQPNTKATVETNDDGVAEFSLDTDSWKDTVILYAVLQTEDGQADMNQDQFNRYDQIFFVHPYYSPSKSLLSVETHKDTLSCDSDITLNVEYHISKDQLETKTDHISFFYLTYNEDGVYSHEEYTKQITEPLGDSDLHGSFHIKVHPNADLSPHFFVLVYAILPKGETLSGINMFQASACFGNKVQLTFSKKQVHPGDEVNLEVSAEAGSVCSVRSIDKGYLLQYPSDDTSFAERIQQGLRRHHGIANEDWEPEHHQCPEDQTVRRRWHPTFDPSFIFGSSGLILLTNTIAKKPVECVNKEEVSARTSQRQKKAKEELRFRPRISFPDTWLFKVVNIGPEGHTELSVTTPDSVTKWMSDAVCLGKSGIGEVRNVELVSFQTYFLDVITPYSVIQGEKFKIDVQLFSYEDKCILVGVTLTDSDDIHTVQSKQQGKCICDGHVSHFSWDATALKPGKIRIHVESASIEIEGTCKEEAFLITKDHKVDSVEKTIKVKARGYEDQITQTHLVCPSDTPEKVSFTLNHPERLVPGTERAHMIVIGDIMGNVIVNLEDILPLPDGCGEQSSSKFSRYCHSLEYLQSTNQLTPETKQKFLEHMTESYQKELTFRNENGSFATFSGGYGDLWITSLVVRTLSCASKFIPIDEQVMHKAIHWLNGVQSANGCFKGHNQYFYHDDDEDHTDEDDLLRTAFVLVSLKEHEVDDDENIVESAKSCLCKGAEKVKTPHTLAFLAYAFTLLGDNERRELMLKQLEDHAEIKNGLKHWPDKKFHYRDADVETTSLVILAHLSGTTVTSKDLEESAYAIRWLVTQQNTRGGFYSSKDTTVALQALGKYARTAKFKKGDSDITIECDSGFHQEVHVNEKNSLLVQTVDLPKIPGTYTASVKGNGCVYIQSHVHYHTLPDAHDNHFSFNVTTEPAVCNHKSQNKFDIHIDARYVGKRAKTNMAVIRVELLSGYVADRKSIRKLERQRHVEKVETSHDHIDIYLDELNHEDKEFVFTVHKEENVENQQPANALIYDYYVTEVHSHAQYNSPCVVAHCKVQASERKDCGEQSITKEDCEKKGCCFDSSIADAKSCFFHDTSAIKLQEEHHSHESQETQQAH